MEAEAFRLHFARNGAEAVGLYEKCSPSIVLTDWLLPDFSGLELCKKIRADESRGYTYIIVMTSNTEKGSVVLGHDAGDTVIKTFAEEVHAGVGYVRAAGRRRVLARDYPCVAEPNGNNH